MGQKTHPKGFRVGVIENWESLGELRSIEGFEGLMTD